MRGWGWGAPGGVGGAMGQQLQTLAERWVGWGAVGEALQPGQRALLGTGQQLDAPCPPVAERRLAGRLRTPPPPFVLLPAASPASMACTPSTCTSPRPSRVTKQRSTSSASRASSPRWDGVGCHAGGTGGRQPGGGESGGGEVWPTGAGAVGCPVTRWCMPSPSNPFPCLDHTAQRTRRAVETTYEVRPVPSDHKVPGSEHQARFGL